MFGAFGFLALGMATYMLRITVRPDAWDESNLRRAFWLWNVGLAVMVFVSVLPVGFLQLEAAFTQNYAFSRSLAFYDSGIVQTLFWARLPGDTLLILGTVVFAYDVVKKRFVVRSVDPDSTGEPSPVSDRVLSGDD
jgi:nitric oxide reductase subunit B